MHFNMADLFEGIADAVPDREAVICGERRLTYRQLDRRANRLAHHLTARGVGPGDHVGCYLHNGTEYLETMLACFKVRAVPVNINFRYVEDELRYLFSDADLVGVVHHREFAPRVAAVRDAMKDQRLFLAVDDGSGAETDSEDYEQALAASSQERGFPERSPDDVYIIYTGGTTGMPKGVMWRHEDLFFAGMGGGFPTARPAATPEEVPERAAAGGVVTMMPAAPLIHGAAQLASFISFWSGYKVVLVPRYRGPEVWRLVEREKVLTITLVGDAMVRPLVEALQEKDYDTSSLLVLSSAGAILSDAVRAQLKAKIPNLTIMDSWGSSETGNQGSAAEGSSPDKGLRFQMNERNSVLDDNLDPVEPGSGVVGMLAQKGNIPLGYYNDPEKTARTFVEKDGVRWVLPGDMATVLEDGTIQVFGRGSVCINSGGEKVYPEEVEAALKAHPDVFDAVVVGVPDPRWGQRVAAVVQPRDGRTPSFADLDAHCRTKVAGYKAPRELHLVAEMRRSPSGKADYPWAKKLAEAGEHRASDAGKSG
jgi:acyl-CoA synthetase (AMP-forming)/AMP-acid ligase II